jgi:UDP-N-acetylglucosamine 2-epimerase (non-hydrolysing)
MSKVFFEDLELPEPDIYLGIGSGTHAEQTGKVMIEFERVLFKEKPDLVMVVGDVNSTLACALASIKLDIPVAHVEAGLRSFDRTMPEEINRILTDQISDFLFTPSPDANVNSKKEGIPEEKIFPVGNVMVDSLLYDLEKAKKSAILYKLGLTKFDRANQINQTNQRNQIDQRNQRNQIDEINQIYAIMIKKSIRL